MGLPGTVWLELVLILAAIPIAIFGGAWLLRSRFGGRRNGGGADLEGRAAPTLTLEVQVEKDGSYSASYVGHPWNGRPRLPRGPESAATLAEVRAVVDPDVLEWYRANRLRDAIVVDYSIFPWGEPGMPADVAARIGTDWLVFDVDEAGRGFTATNRESGVDAAADSLDALPSAVRAAVAARWPSLANDVPGMLTWQRTLTDHGFDVPR